MIVDTNIKETLQSMFSPKQYSTEKAYKILMDYGGISCNNIYYEGLINDLGTNHQIGLSSYK